MGQKEVSAAVLARPDALETICANVANGGSLINLCRVWDIRYSDAVAWIYADEERKEKYEQSLIARTEWEKERLLEEIKAIALVSVSDVYNDDGTLKQLKDMKPETLAAIAGVESEDHFEDGVPKAHTNKVRMYDKLRALELLGKKLAMFIDRHEHKVGLTLEELVAGSFDKQKEETHE